MVNACGYREVEYNCRAPVWLFKDAKNNVFQSPQKEPSRRMIIHYKTGRKAGRAALKCTRSCTRAPKRIYADAHGLSVFSGPYCCRGERLWVLGASDTNPVTMRVVSLDTRQRFYVRMDMICFVPQLQIVDDAGRKHYITPVAENWFVQWPVGQPQLVERKEGPLPDEPTIKAALRKQSFRDEWAAYKGLPCGGHLGPLQQEWEDKMEEDGLKYLQEFTDTSDMGEKVTGSFELPVRSVAQ